MRKQPLTEEQMQVLAFAPVEASDESLAREIGAPVATVHSVRWRLKRDGWTCRVSYGICNVCSQPLIRRGYRAGRTQYHDHCRPVALKQITARIDRRRWEELDEPARKQVLERAHTHVLEGQRTTREQAVFHGRRWSAEEDQLIMDPAAAADHELALSLGRSLYAVRARRRILVARSQATTSIT